MKTSARSVVLSRSELDYLSSANFLPLFLLEFLQNSARWKSDVAATLELSEAMAEEVRDALTEQLAKVGFDEAYGPTPEGKLLEDLIDRFH